jgi:hypothetical protein
MERQQLEQLLELLVEQDQISGRQAVIEPKGINGVYRGMVSEIDLTSGVIRIVIPTVFGMEPVAVRSVVPLSKERIGEEVLVAFEAGDSHLPYIIGALWKPDQPPTVFQSPIEAKVDGEQVVIEGKKEILLKCGKASIQLLADGSVRIRGTEVLNRASGTNRIRGGNVQIN